MKPKFPTMIASMAFAATAQAATISLTVEADSFLRSDTAPTPGEADSDREILVGSTNSTIRGLVRFNTTSLSSLGPIQINSVSLIGTNRSGDNGAGGSINLSVHEYAFEFIEATASWNDPDGDGTGAGDSVGGTWGTLVASLDNHNVAVATVANFISGGAFVNTVENAISGDDTVNLLIKESIENGGTNYVRFADRLNADNNPFRLEVDYTVLTAIPEPSASLLLGLASCIALVRRKRA